MQETVEVTVKFYSYSPVVMEIGHLINSYGVKDGVADRKFKLLKFASYQQTES